MKDDKRILKKMALKALEMPLYLTIALIITSLIGRRNIIADELTTYLILLPVSWAIVFGVRAFAHYFPEKKQKAVDNPDS